MVCEAFFEHADDNDVAAGAKEGCSFGRRDYDDLFYVLKRGNARRT